MSKTIEDEINELVAVGADGKTMNTRLHGFFGGMSEEDTPHDTDGKEVEITPKIMSALRKWKPGNSAGTWIIGFRILHIKFLKIRIWIIFQKIF